MLEDGADAFEAGLFVNEECAWLVRRCGVFGCVRRGCSDDGVGVRYEETQVRFGDIELRILSSMAASTGRALVLLVVPATACRGYPCEHGL